MTNKPSLDVSAFANCFDRMLADEVLPKREFWLAQYERHSALYAPKMSENEFLAWMAFAQTELQFFPGWVDKDPQSEILLMFTIGQHLQKEVRLLNALGTFRALRGQIYDQEIAGLKRTGGAI